MENFLRWQFPPPRWKWIFWFKMTVEQSHFESKKCPIWHLFFYFKDFTDRSYGSYFPNPNRHICFHCLNISLEKLVVNDKCSDTKVPFEVNTHTLCSKNSTTLFWSCLMALTRFTFSDSKRQCYLKVHRLPTRSPWGRNVNKGLVLPKTLAKWWTVAQASLVLLICLPCPPESTSHEFFSLKCNKIEEHRTSWLIKTAKAVANAQVFEAGFSRWVGIVSGV